MATWLHGDQVSTQLACPESFSMVNQSYPRPGQRRLLSRRVQAGSLTGELAFNYLLHEGRLESAAAVARDILGDVVQVRILRTCQFPVQTRQLGFSLEMDSRRRPCPLPAPISGRAGCDILGDILQARTWPCCQFPAWTK